MTSSLSVACTPATRQPNRTKPEARTRDNRSMRATLHGECRDDAIVDRGALGRNHAWAVVQSRMRFMAPGPDASDRPEDPRGSRRNVSEAEIGGRDDGGRDRRDCVVQPLMAGEGRRPGDHKDRVAVEEEHVLAAHLVRHAAVQRLLGSKPLRRGHAHRARIASPRSNSSALTTIEGGEGSAGCRSGRSRFPNCAGSFCARKTWLMPMSRRFAWQVTNREFSRLRCTTGKIRSVAATRMLTATTMSIHRAPDGALGGTTAALICRARTRRARHDAADLPPGSNTGANRVTNRQARWARPAGGSNVRRAASSGRNIRCTSASSARSSGSSINCSSSRRCSESSSAPSR